jgi:hypothetical protein
MIAAGLVLLSACGPALEQRYDASRAIRVVYTPIPGCPATSLGSVQGASILDLQREAQVRQAHAVILNDTTGEESTASARFSGTAIRWAEGDSCHK